MTEISLIVTLNNQFNPIHDDLEHDQNRNMTNK